MAKTTTAPITQSIKNAYLTFVNADGNVGTTLTNSPSNTKKLLTAGAEGSILKVLKVTSDDSSARVLNFYLSLDGGTTKTHIGSVNIPINSGANGTTADIDILASTVFLGMAIDQSGKPVLPLAPSAEIYVGPQASVTSARFINVLAVAEDF